MTNKTVSDMVTARYVTNAITYNRNRCLEENIHGRLPYTGLRMIFTHPAIWEALNDLF